MKKYIKPSIETVEANLIADWLQASRVYGEKGNGQLAPGKKDYYIQEEEEDYDYGW